MTNSDERGAGAGDTPMATVADLLSAGSGALRRLGQVGEQVEDELQYVNDLLVVYEGRFRQVASERGGEPVSPEQADATRAAIEEALLIEDPHRAIDWLSTLPQVLLFTIGETA